MHRVEAALNRSQALLSAIHHTQYQNRGGIMAIAVLLILLVGIVLFVTEIFPLPVTAMSMCVAFYLTGAVDASKALSAFSSSTASLG